MKTPKYSIKSDNCLMCGSLIFIRFDNSISITKGEIHCPFCNQELYNWADKERSYSLESTFPAKSEIEYANYLLNLPVCPICGGMLIEKMGRRGKFWGCKNYPKCKYISKK
jgi:DNA topoisomerase-1